MGDTRTDREHSGAGEGYEPPTLEVVGTLQDVTLGSGGRALPDEFETVVS